MMTAWLHVERPSLTSPAPASHPLDFHKLSLFSSETGNITLASGQNPLLAVAKVVSGQSFSVSDGRMAQASSSATGTTFAVRPAS